MNPLPAHALGLDPRGACNFPAGRPAAIAILGYNPRVGDALTRDTLPRTLKLKDHG